MFVLISVLFIIISAEVRGQLSGNGSLLPLWDPGINQGWLAVRFVDYLAILTI